MEVGGDGCCGGGGGWRRLEGVGGRRGSRGVV